MKILLLIYTKGCTINKDIYVLNPRFNLGLCLSSTRLRHLAYFFAVKAPCTNSSLFLRTFLPRKKPQFFSLSLVFLSSSNGKGIVTRHNKQKKKSLLTLPRGAQFCTLFFFLKKNCDLKLLLGEAVFWFQKRRCCARNMRYMTTSGGARVRLYLYRDSKSECFPTAPSLSLSLSLSQTVFVRARIVVRAFRLHSRSNDPPRNSVANFHD